MSRNAFPQIEREYAEDQGYREMMREERREIQRQKATGRGMELDYEQTDRTSGCCDLDNL